MAREVVQTRVDSEVEEQLQRQADQRDKSLAEYLRNVLWNVSGIHDPDPTLLEAFEQDIRNLVVSRQSDVTSPLERISEETWDTITNDELNERLHDVLEESEIVYVAGQGTSLSAANWLAEELNQRGTRAQAGTAEEISRAVTTDDAAGVFISHSGESDRIVTLTEAFEESRTIALTSPGSTLADVVDTVVPMPGIEEAVEEYASRSLVGQLITLQTAFFDDDPRLEDLEATMDAVDEFIAEQLKLDSEEPALRKGSPFASVVRTLEENDDLVMTPIVSTLGELRALDVEMRQKFTEFLHAPACRDDLRSLKDRLVNPLYSGDGVLFSVVPREPTSSYDRYAINLFRGEDSIDNRLKVNRDPTPLRMVALSLNASEDGDGGYVERLVRERSLYGDDSVIELPDQEDPFANDLLILAATFLLVFAILSRRWNQDRDLRQAIIRRVYSNPDILGDVDAE